MAKGDDIQERLIDFAVTIIHLTSHLPKNRAANHISGQILRSGTSPAPNYGEARAGESKKDFVHKLKIVLNRHAGSRTIQSAPNGHENDILTALALFANSVLTVKN